MNTNIWKCNLVLVYGGLLYYVLYILGMLGRVWEKRESIFGMLGWSEILSFTL